MQVFKTPRWLALTLMSAVAPVGVQTATPSKVHSLRPLAASGLERAYGIAVVEVPPPPADLLAVYRAEQSPQRRACPVDVRAVVDGPDEAFAILSLGDDSRLVRPGQSLRVRGVDMYVAAVVAGRVVLRSGGDRWVCLLSD